MAVAAPGLAWLSLTHKPDFYRVRDTQPKGEREKAVDYYGRFIDLWRQADPEARGRVGAMPPVVSRWGGQDPG